jgi:RNA polymerase sigma-70 factor (ECF subfamily)
MVAQREDAEDLLQDVMLEAVQELPHHADGSRMKTWLFGLATRRCVEHLRQQWRWRPEAHLIAESAEDAEPEAVEQLRDALSKPDFVFDVREHVAFCFSCVGRSLPSEQQAALMLREIFQFTLEECALIMNEPAASFDGLLRAGRSAMISSYDGLCTLTDSEGRCGQCRELGEWAPEGHRGENIEQIQPEGGVVESPDSLLDARLKIVREADLEGGTSRQFHRWFFDGLTHQESGGG